MSSESTTAQDLALAVFMCNLAHAKPYSAFNRLYSVKFNSTLLNNQIDPTTHAKTINKFCSKCGLMWIPGLTVSIRIAYKKRKKKSRVLEYKCGQCQNVMEDQSLIQHRPDLHTNRTMSTSTRSAKLHDESLQDIASVGNIKNGSKKRRLNTLSNMLAQKKQRDQGASQGIGSLSLQEFLK